MLPSRAVETYSYNASGVRVTKTASATTTRFVIDGQNVLAETSESGHTLRSWTHASNRWGGLLSEHSEDATHTFCFDSASNTRLLTDKAGSVSSAFAYDAFGVERTTGREGYGTPFRFGGEYGYLIGRMEGSVLMFERGIIRRGKGVGLAKIR